MGSDEATSVALVVKPVSLAPRKLVSPLDRYALLLLSKTRAQATPCPGASVMLPDTGRELPKTSLGSVGVRMGNLWARR